MIEFHGMDRGVLLFRKHLARYLDGLDCTPEERECALTKRDAAALRRVLGSLGLAPGRPSRALPTEPHHAVAA
jgi:hypothetical protein